MLSGRGMLAFWVAAEGCDHGPSQTGAEGLVQRGPWRQGLGWVPQVGVQAADLRFHLQEPVLALKWRCAPSGLWEVVRTVRGTVKGGAHGDQILVTWVETPLGMELERHAGWRTNQPNPNPLPGLGCFHAPRSPNTRSHHPKESVQNTSSEHAAGLWPRAPHHWTLPPESPLGPP